MPPTPQAGAVAGAVHGGWGVLGVVGGGLWGVVGGGGRGE